VVDSDLAFDNPMIRLKIDRSKANDLGISMQTIGIRWRRWWVRTTPTASASRAVLRSDHEVPRTLRLSPESLTQFYVRTAGGQEIPLSTVVSVETEVQPNKLTRYNQLNAATFQAVPAMGVSMGQCVDFLMRYAETLPKNVQTAFLSESRQFTQEGGRLSSHSSSRSSSSTWCWRRSMKACATLGDSHQRAMSVCVPCCRCFFGVTTMNIYTQIGLVTLIASSVSTVF